MQKNYLIAIVSIVLIVGIVLFITNYQSSLSSPDISGQAAKIATKTTAAKTTTSSAKVTKTVSKNSAVTKTVTYSAKKATTKTFCGDASCADGTHISCYENSKGECECAGCPKISIETLNNLYPENVKKKGLRSIPAPTIDPDAYIVNCQSDTRYTTGAPVIDAFMMEFLTGIDEKTLQDFADFAEIAFCNATNGEININITAMKYNWTNTTYPENFTDYKPFRDDYWEYLWDHDEYQDILDLTYGEILSEEDLPRFYYRWSVYESGMPNSKTFEEYAEEIGYDENKYDLRITLNGAAMPNGYPSGLCCPVFIRELNIYESTTEEDLISKSSRFERDKNFYGTVETLLHEVGHYLDLTHACDDVGCDNCPWANDVMSYCSDSPAPGEEYFNGYMGCNIDFLENSVIPFFPTEPETDSDCG